MNVAYNLLLVPYVLFNIGEYQYGANQLSTKPYILGVQNGNHKSLVSQNRFPENEIEATMANWRFLFHVT